MSAFVDLHPDELVERARALAKLREPFPAEKVGKLPRAQIKSEDYKQLKKEHCDICGGFHPATATMHLDFVGHADVTARLLDADMTWSWEPLALQPDGLPRFVFNAAGDPVGLWIRLTVGGVTRIGFGSVPGGAFDAEKQLIGDALRNAAMRFGVALDLWRKELPPAEANHSGSRQRASRGAAEAPAGPVEPGATQAPLLPHEGEPCPLCADLGWTTATAQEPTFRRNKDGKLLFCNGRRGDAPTEFAAHEPEGQDIPF